MPKIVAQADVAANRKMNELAKGGSRWGTTFMSAAVPDVAQDPHAFLIESTPEDSFGIHFHRVDEFQVFLSGGGVMGRHPLSPNMVHFARANTPYGPIRVGDKGLSFLTLRASVDGSGRHFFPKGKAELDGIPDRDPWQVTDVATFAPANGVALRALSRIDDKGSLSAYTLALAPGAKTAAPDPSTTAGQYLVITQGSFRYDGKEHAAITIVFVKSDEKAFELEAGPEGLNALVLNFPRNAKGRAPDDVARPTHGFRVWACRLCAFSYDEAKGMPEEGIAPGTRWEDVPASWSCPDCSASKDDFDMQVVD